MNRFRTSLPSLVWMVLLVGLPQSAPLAQDSLLLNGMRWRQVGPNRGGRVTTVTGVPSQPNTFYMGVASGGVWRTTDAGASWNPISDRHFDVASLGDIAVSLSDLNTIICTHGLRSNVSTGRGVYKSTDNGPVLAVRRPPRRGTDWRGPHAPDRPNVAYVAATATSSSATSNAGSSRPRTADAPGGRCSTSPTAPARRTSSCSPETRMWSSRSCPAPSASRGRSSAARIRRIYKSTTGGEMWTRLSLH